jgi:hypothetical protein
VDDRCRFGLRIGVPEADQDFVHSVLQPGGRFVQLTRSLGSKLAQFVTILDMSHGAENQLGTHENYSSFQYLPKGSTRAPREFCPAGPGRAILTALDAGNVPSGYNVLRLCNTGAQDKTFPGKTQRFMLWLLQTPASYYLKTIRFIPARELRRVALLFWKSLKWLGLTTDKTM